MQALGITIIMGAGDRERTRSGEHGAHNATSVFAWLLHFVLPEDYTPFTADVLVTDRYDLAPCGIAGEVSRRRATPRVTSSWSSAAARSRSSAIFFAAAGSAASSTRPSRWSTSSG
jgi:hypothetical protein